MHLLSLRLPAAMQNSVVEYLQVGRGSSISWQNSPAQHVRPRGQWALSRWKWVCAHAIQVSLDESLSASATVVSFQIFAGHRVEPLLGDLGIARTAGVGPNCSELAMVAFLYVVL